MEKHNEYGKESFLEKVFQIQFDLSHVDRFIIKDKVFNYLVEKMPELKTEIQGVLYPEVSASDAFAMYLTGVPASDQYLTRILTNIRDVKRFVNTFSLNIKQVASEVIFSQYFHLSLIKFKYPRLIAEIKQNKIKYIKEELKPFQHQTLIMEAIKEAFEHLKIAEHERTTIEEIFINIYDNPSSTPDTRSILLIDNFYVYYDNSLTSKGILYGQVLSAIDKSWEESEGYIEELILSGKGNGLAGVLDDIDIYKTVNRFKNATNAWISIANLGNGQDRNLSVWLDDISNNYEKIEKFIGKDFKDYFKSIFLPQKSPFFYSTYIIRIILRKYIDKEKFKFPLSEIELKSIAVQRLDMFIKSIKDFDTRAFTYFYYNCWKGKTDDNRVLLMDEANSIIISYVKKFPVEYLRYVIRSKFTPHLDDIYVFEPFIPQYFGSWDSFEEFLRKIAAEHKEFAVMVKYFEIYKSSGNKEFATEMTPEWIIADENGNSALKYYKDQTNSGFVEMMKELYK